MAPYSPQANAVERANRVIKTMITQYVRDNHQSWDQYLEEFHFALNTERHESTDFTSSMLHLGRELKPPQAVCGPAVETTHGAIVRAIPEVQDD